MGIKHNGASTLTFQGHVTSSVIGHVTIRHAIPQFL